MSLLVMFVFRHQKTIITIGWRDVARQSFLYLFGIYWTYLFVIINNGRQYYSEETNFPMALFSVVNLNLQGVWVLMIYRHFGVPSSASTHSTEDYLEERSPQRSVSKSTARTDDDEGVSSRTLTVEAPKPPRRIARQSSASRPRPAASDFGFNIFDGTNAAGPYSQYIFDGDEDDIEEDKELSEHWKAAQNHV